MAYPLRNQLDDSIQGTIEFKPSAMAGPPSFVAGLLPYLNAMRHGLLLIDARGRVVLASGQTLRLLGGQAASVAEGSSLRQVLNVIRDHAGDTWSEVRTRLPRSLAQPATHTFEVTLQGHLLEVHLQPVTGGRWAVAFEDVTARRAA
ncbi:PAS-domain containing protein, partial [Methylobacterium sp. J-090]|uniref:PAS-domain containing protein n=1 Tax=Methylobacterium sp. J-090 TaxID=2836666 RepID=UPI001FBB6396